MRYLLLSLLLATSALAVTPDTTSHMLDSTYDRGTAWARFLILGTDSVRWNIDLRDVFGGNGKFNSHVYYTWYRSDKDTANSATSDSTDVTIRSGYGAVVKKEKPYRSAKWRFSDDLLTIDSSTTGMQIARETNIYDCSYKDLYTIAYNSGEYDAVRVSYDSVKAGGGTVTWNINNNMRQHSAMTVLVFGNGKNAKRKQDKVAPFDSTRGTIVEIYVVKSPGDLDIGAPVNQSWLEK